MSLHIRHATLADYEAIHRIHSGPRATAGSLQLPYASPEVWRKRLAEPEPGLVLLLACHEAEPVGVLGLHSNAAQSRRRHSAWLGMVVRDDWQRKGVGTALMKAALDLADNWLNLERLDLTVYMDNEPALRLYRKFGFEIEGTHRRYAFRGGQYVDAHTMARLHPARAAGPP